MSRRLYKGLSVLGNDNVVFPPGTLSVDAATSTIRVHNGVTPGGMPLELGSGAIAEPEEDFVITTRYGIPSSPPGPVPVYFDVNYTFGTDGFLTFPPTSGGINCQSTLQLRANAAITIGLQPQNPDIYIGNSAASDSRIEIAGQRFRITAAVPTSSKGTAGDNPNMISLDSNYIYICTGNWDGVADIWKRVSLIGGAW